MGTATTLSLDSAKNSTATKSFTRHLPTAARVLMGLTFAVFGLDGFLHYFPQPSPEQIPAGVMALAGAIQKSGYLFQLIKGTEVLAAVLLLANRFVPLALAFIAPVIVNIIAFHLFLDPADLAIPVILLGLEVYLAWSYRAVFRPMLAARVAR